MIAFIVKSAACAPAIGAMLAIPAMIEAIERFISVIRVAFNLNSFNNFGVSIIQIPPQKNIKSSLDLQSVYNARLSASPFCVLTGDNHSNAQFQTVIWH
jgi:hypothetical protein